MPSSNQLIPEGLDDLLCHASKRLDSKMVCDYLSTHIHQWWRIDCTDYNGRDCISGRINSRITCRSIHGLNLWFFSGVEWSTR